MKIDKKRNNRQGPHRNGKDGDPEPRLEELGVANAVHPETREGGNGRESCRGTGGKISDQATTQLSLATSAL